ncbi:uroporphyrinogen decarboxylase family protein [Chloroflexota bacterium]
MDEDNTGKSPGEFYEEREKRVRDAVSLTKPDRVPVIIGGGYFAARYAGLSASDIYYNPGAVRKALEKTILDFEPDMGGGHSGLAGSGTGLELLDPKWLIWPGHGLANNVSHQFIEDEYLRAEEYDLFITDPTDFILRYYLPRVFKSLEALSELDPVMPIHGSAAFTNIFHQFGSPELKDAAEALYRAGQEQVKWRETMAGFEERMADLGFPLSAHTSFGAAPFDAISDYLRGMEASMTDMYRYPEKLVAACEKIMDWRLARSSPADPETRGNPKRAGGAILRGADGFMSDSQFRRFYWPGLKKSMESMINLGYVPFLFCEGTCDTRLEYFLELPRGKFVMHLDESDMKLAKNILGNHCCIMGNVPASLLTVGSPREVENYCRNLFETVGVDGGFILTSGGFLDDASPVNVKAMVDSAKNYGWY